MLIKPLPQRRNHRQNNHRQVHNRQNQRLDQDRERNRPHRLLPRKAINGLPKHQETIFKAGAGMRGTVSQAEHALRGVTMTRRARSVETAFADFLLSC
jgi:hypothetical protein